MSILGIVAEFNPFHNGHQYLINTVKEKYNFDAIVCVMSGNFTQRGEPAICNKWARAEMALNAGVDLVIELPFCFATRSAYYFAKGAIELLELTKVVTHIAFGSEMGDIEQLKDIARLLNEEPDDYKKLLKKQLNKGFSYPMARSIA
ncbi:MAG: nucleotidyltransferase family protein, partial [Syntrophomonadaceae bacterium]|nr:nucleotidyltransferase family protein [Syntrophomonadaceae bacterium]